MTQEITTDGAIPSLQRPWQDLHWQAIKKNVQRLQARIVKAAQDGRWGKVKALQHLLTHSFSGKALAVKRVTGNEGRRTSGVDRQLWFTHQRKRIAINELKVRGYKPLPLRRIHIPKSNGSKRPLGIPTMKDRAMQALYLLALDPVAEVKGDRNSYGFRKGRSSADAIEQCFCILAKSKSPEWILEGDIQSCFDQINHDWLLANVSMDKSILRKWLKAGFMEKNTFYRTEAGTPQGSIISPVLANLTLDGLEKTLKEKYPKLSRKPAPGVHLVRYADDFIITSRFKDKLEEEIIPLLENFLNTRGLKLSREKTKVTHIEQGFDFLGQNVRKYKGKLLIKPSKDSQKALMKKTRGIIKANKQATSADMIAYLSPIIRGWANYHQHIVSTKVFAKVDTFVFKSLWRWCKRRHPRKSKGWIKKKYFGSFGDRTWVFQSKFKSKGGEIKISKLFSAGALKIKRHIKVQNMANPYDREWAGYFAQRERKAKPQINQCEPRSSKGAL